jgi:CSLREA domain-containing protein
MNAYIRADHLSAARKYLSLLLIFSIVGCAALSLLSPWVAPSQAAPADTTFTVNTNADYDPGAVDGACSNGAGGACGLREAIKEANVLSSGNTHIEFSSGMAGLTITLNGTDAWGGSLVISGDHVVINGLTGSALITIDAVNLPANSNLFEVQGNYNQLHNLRLKGWTDTRYPTWPYGHGVRIYDPGESGKARSNFLNYLTIIDFERDGILVYGGPSESGNNNFIDNSLIGIETGSTACGHGNREEGIEITNGADNTYIYGNFIGCNTNSGIWLDGRPGGQMSGTDIISNRIGSLSDLDFGNGLVGIADFQTTDTEIKRNVISGNGNEGVWLMGSTYITLTANLIGVSFGGFPAIPNGYSGVKISDSAHHITLGLATDASSGNTISGTGESGVFIASSSNILLERNYIGLGGAAGSLVIPNNQAGVAIFDSNTILLSTVVPTATQYISGNYREGVYALNSVNIFINAATSIGVLGDDRSAAGNGLEGVKLDSGTTHSTIRPGKILNNGSAGIVVLGDSSTGNNFGPQMIGANGGLPIDLGGDGHTANGTQTPPGPNNWINYPEVNMTASGGFTGITCPGCLVYFYQVSGDPTANGGGGSYLYYTYADGTTGDFSFSFPPGVQAVSMVAYSLSTYDSSEMGPSVANDLSFVFLPMVRK